MSFREYRSSVRFAANMITIRKEHRFKFHRVNSAMR